MKRLLTYGLLLLTILASHFVVSACQDDSDKTTIVMTFTTRVENPPLDETTGESAEVPKEQMKELRIIMAREDGTVIYNEKTGVEGNEHEFSFDVPMMTYKERFQFVVIANETALVSTDGTAIDLSKVDKDAFNNLKTLKIGQDGFFFGDSQCIPQTIYWAQDITYGETTKIRKELQFVVGKITVEFKNETEETQSLSGIHIKGIIPNAQAYLLAQASNDFVGTQHDASAMQDADIIFNPVTDLSVGGSSPIQHYYTYPVGSYGVASSTLSFTQSEETYEQPTLFATWNGKEYNLPITEVTDEEGNVHNFTSLARNERLKIVITLTPAGDITVNYTIHSWEETPTNIGGEAPTIPGNDDGNGYNTENWGASNDIEIGGGGQIWDLGNGTTIKGEQSWTYEKTDFEVNDRIELNLPKEVIEPGNTIILYFKGYVYSQTATYDQIKVKFETVWGNDYTINDEYQVYDYVADKEYVRYLTLTEEMMMLNGHSLKDINLVILIRDEDDKPIHIKVSKLLLVTPSSQAAQ